MEFDLAKMEGAGNDFVVLSGSPPEPSADARLARWLCDRRRGIGADGLLWLERLPEDPEILFRMHFYNADGSRAALCLNGSRCCARRAVELGWVVEGSRFAFRTDRQTLLAQVDGREVSVWIDPPTGAPRAIELGTDAVAPSGWAVDTGDPHLVVPVSAEALEREDFVPLARGLRQARPELPDGANVHWVASGGDVWQIRSYERGVEDETLACGSGCLATVLSLGGGGERRLRTAGGDLLRVTPAPGRWRVTGPARTVFTTRIRAEGSRDDDA